MTKRVQKYRVNWVVGLLTALLAVSGVTRNLNAQESLDEVLAPEQWQQIDQSVERALSWLASQQQTDGSFPTHPTGQPAITSLVTMAFLANGHLPGEGPYGDHLELAISYVQGTQKRHGMLALPTPNSEKIPRRFGYLTGKSVAYNHAIAALMLCEAYSMQGQINEGESRQIIEKALKASLIMQGWPKSYEEDQGGWRYAHDDGDRDSDLSLTGWQLIFLRSAKNAGFDVAERVVDNAVQYVLRCYCPDYGTYNYYIKPEDRRSRGMAGAGVLALAHAGLHNTKEARQTDNWILQNGFEDYNRIKRFNQIRWYNDRYHYGMFYCSQAMYQLGGEYWKRFFPAASSMLLKNQRPEGCWSAEDESESGRYGNIYSTSLCVLSLDAPNQLLPIFQRKVLDQHSHDAMA